MARELQRSSSKEQRSWLDPFEMMQEDMDRLFGSYFRRLPTIGAERGDGGGRQIAHLDIRETEDEIKVEIDMPGVKMEDIDITLADNLLHVRGKRESSREATGESFHRVEREFGAFERRISLPYEIDAENIDASLDDGVLTIRLPKSATAKEQAHRIEVHKKASQEASRKPLE